MVLLPLLPLLASALSANPALGQPATPPKPTRLRFEVRVDRGLLSEPVSGRLLVVLGQSNLPEPRQQIGSTGWKAPPLLGQDVVGFGPQSRAVLDRNSALFPLATLSDLPAGDYWAQAVLRTNLDLLLTEAPGNLSGSPTRVHIDPARGGTVRLSLDRRLPEETLPPDSEWVRYVKIRSECLSAFWGRPMFLRAGIILPRGWAEEPARRYPLLITIGGFGTRFTAAGDSMREEHPFRSAWLADDAPRLVRLQVDGAGPLGDPYQVDSDNHGPYGEALTTELIPQVEAAFRCIGQPHARLLTGGSTGGWVSLALQVLYPDFFGGCWSGFPDPPDFRALQLVNIYEDANAFTNSWGFERPCARTAAGDTEFTMRHETQLENVLGAGNSFRFSGGQWGSWNATYSPRLPSGEPAVIWDPRTGALDRAVATAWARYDLRRVLSADWSRVAPSLKGKIRIWMGDADTYFLDGATRLFDAYLATTEPPSGVRIEFAAGQRHGWQPRSWPERLREMQAAVDAGAPKSTPAQR